MADGHVAADPKDAPMTLNREEVLGRLAEVAYVADPQLATAIVLMQQLGRPLLLEGEAGVGKTEVAKALAAVLDAPLIRLQCYEGLDANAAVYEWDYQRQLLAIKIWESEERSAEEKERQAPIHRRDMQSHGWPRCLRRTCWPRPQDRGTGLPAQRSCSS